MSLVNEEKLKGGRFFGILKRNYSQIKNDRAIQIVEDAEMELSRKIQDIERNIRSLTRDRDGLLDLSPSHTTQIITASDFDAGAFVDTDLQKGIQLREETIRLEIATTRYNELFGDTTEGAK